MLRYTLKCTYGAGAFVPGVTAVGTLCSTGGMLRRYATIEFTSASDIPR